MWAIIETDRQGSHWLKESLQLKLLFTVCSAVFLFTAMTYGATPTQSNFTTRLVKSGWSRKAAEAVVQINLEFLITCFEIDYGYGEKYLDELADLGAYPEIMPLLHEQPNLSGLFVMANQYQDETMRGDLVESFSFMSEDDIQRIGNLFMCHFAFEDARVLAAFAARRKHLLIQLSEKGFTGQESVFLMPINHPKDAAFVDWAADEIDVALRQGNERVAEMFGFLVTQGVELRRRFRSEADFTVRFRERYWPLLRRIAKATPEYSLDQYANNPKIWDFFLRDNAEALLRRSGPLAVVFLEGDEISPAYPISLHPVVEKLLLEGDGNAIFALYHFNRNAMFLKLLGRGISSDSLRSAISQLLALSQSADKKQSDVEKQTGEVTPSAAMKNHIVNDRLTYWNSLSDAALSKELGPPPSGVLTWIPFYDTVNVPIKFFEGREIGTLELIAAVADPAFIVADITSSGGTAFLRQGLKTTLKEGVKTTVRKTASGGMRGVLENTSRELLEWGMKKSSVDVTSLVRGMFKSSGMGRGSFKKLTSLEARIFMRPDARIVIVPIGIATGHTGGVIVKETASGLAAGTALETELGKEVVGKMILYAIAAPEKLRDNLNSWRQHSSAWWLMNAVGFPEEIMEMNR